jgi:hypothetical protein
LKKKGPISDISLSTQAIGHMHKAQFDRMFNFVVEQCRVTTDEKLREASFDLIPNSQQEEPQREHAFKQMEAFNQILACGFMQPEAVLEEMKQPMQVRRFDIYSNPDSESSKHMKALAEDGWRNSQILTAIY